MPENLFWEELGSLNNPDWKGAQISSLCVSSAGELSLLLWEPRKSVFQHENKILSKIIMPSYQTHFPAPPFESQWTSISNLPSIIRSEDILALKMKIDTELEKRVADWASTLKCKIQKQGQSSARSRVKPMPASSYVCSWLKAMSQLW